MTLFFDLLVSGSDRIALSRTDFPVAFSQVVESKILGVEGYHDFARWAVPLFRDNQLSLFDRVLAALASHLFVRFFVFRTPGLSHLVVRVSVDENDYIRFRLD